MCCDQQAYFTSTNAQCLCWLLLITHFVFRRCTMRRGARPATPRASAWRCRRGRRGTQQACSPSPAASRCPPASRPTAWPRPAATRASSRCTRSPSACTPTSWAGALLKYQASLSTSQVKLPPYHGSSCRCTRSPSGCTPTRRAGALVTSHSEKQEQGMWKHGLGYLAVLRCTAAGTCAGVVLHLMLQRGGQTQHTR